ncbi:MAG: YigZ family protein [Clostridia bacterium]|nr:YigZ family protein [Clostridia bacterium]
MNGEIFRTVAGDMEIELEEKRSTFIAAVRRVATEEEAEAFVKERRRLHPSARHTVHAYILKKGAERYADDSEPQGTAGVPTLEAIRRAGLSDVCIATTRYFGGILLGTGGLTRAYGGAAQRVLDAAGVAEFVPFTDYLLDCTYPDYQKLLQELPKFEGRERGVEFADRVRLTVGVPAEQGERFAARVVDHTAGRCVPEKKETVLDSKTL